MSGSVAICAICLQDARPKYEDLLSVSACGHVFHEPCLQRWMETSSAGRHPTCPLCKGPISCRVHGVHRLSVESAGSDSPETQVSPSRNLQTVKEVPEHVNCTSGICKLERQLDAAMISSTVMNSIIEQFTELESQVAVNLQRAEEAEGATRAARGELARCIKDSLEKIMLLKLELDAVKEVVEMVRTFLVQTRSPRWDWCVRVTRILYVTLLVFFFFRTALEIPKMLAERSR